MSVDAHELGDSGERMVPDVHKDSLIYAEHLTRYLAAKGLVKDKVVLDIASGSGYGTKILAEFAKKVIGVDVSAEAIDYAKKQYAGKNITYLVGDGESIPLEDDSVDVVVTFETIEHIKDYKKFLAEISRVLRPDGLAIISTPNDLEFAEGNHYHLHEFEYNELLQLLKKQFKFTSSYFQFTWKYVALASEEQFTEKEHRFPVLNLSAPKREECLYFYILCSNRKLTEKINAIGAVGEHYSDRTLIGKEMTHEKNISDYKAVVKAIRDENRQLAHERDIYKKELEVITNSRSYQIISKLRHIVRG